MKRGPIANPKESRSGAGALPAALAGLAALASWSADPASAAGSPAKPAAPVARRTTLNFDDGLVEGLNRKPLDSMTQLNEAEGKNGARRLYEKKAAFDAETDELIQQMRYQ